MATRRLKDKSYAGQVDGIPFHLRASKRPDKETTEALAAMVKLVYNKKLTPKP